MPPTPWGRSFPRPRGRGARTVIVQALRTFAAFFPFGPEVTSNSTRCPSARVRNPSPLISLKWTKMSSPPSSVLKTNPFASLNHFAVPDAESVGEEFAWVDPAGDHSARLTVSDLIVYAKRDRGQYAKRPPKKID